LTGKEFMTLEVSVIAPTLNERENVPRLIELLDAALAGRSWEVIFVDDNSTDGTQDQVMACAADDPRVRLIERVGRRGLSSACIEGFMSSAADHVAVIDADLQHDERLLPQMLAAFGADPALDIVVGSRFVEGGGLGDWGKMRIAASNFAKSLSYLVVPQKVTDPMSGFFMLRRSSFRKVVPELSGRGFKILLDILCTAGKNFRMKELPYEFKTRQWGESKLNSMVMLEYVALLVDKSFGKLLPLRFIMFIMMGFVGMGVNLAILAILYKGGIAGFMTSHIIGAFAAMSVNFVLNNAFTYSDRKLAGGRLVLGLLLFYVLCSFGLFFNVLVAERVLEAAGSWLLAGFLGAVVGAVWNYATNTTLNWRAQ
jgi:dolichol-phosphate mannosyltransferase